MMGDVEAAVEVERHNFVPGGSRLEDDLAKALGAGLLEQGKQDTPADTIPAVLDRDGHTHDFGDTILVGQQRAGPYDGIAQASHQEGRPGIGGGNVIQVRIFGGVEKAPMLDQAGKDERLDRRLVGGLKGLEGERVYEVFLNTFSTCAWVEANSLRATFLLSHKIRQNTYRII